METLKIFGIAVTRLGHKASSGAELMETLQSFLTEVYSCSVTKLLPELN